MTNGQGVWIRTSREDAGMLLILDIERGFISSCPIELAELVGPLIETMHTVTI